MAFPSSYDYSMWRLAAVVPGKSHGDSRGYNSKSCPVTNFHLSINGLELVNLKVAISVFADGGHARPEM
jgi:hypothetical protein